MRLRLLWTRENHRLIGTHETQGDKWRLMSLRLYWLLMRLKKTSVDS